MSNALLESLIERLQWLVDIPSVTGEEKAIADAVEGKLRGYQQFQRLRWRHNIALWPKAEPPQLLLVGHLDTVPPAPGQTRRRQDGKIYGCGTCDMKAGVAVMLEMLERQSEKPLAYLFYDQEEGALVNNGLGPLLERLPFTGVPAVVLEPTNGEVQVGCVGSFHLEVTFRGVRAHSARPWQGDNAIYQALPLLQHLSRREPEEYLVEGQVFRQVITPTVLSSPTLKNAVPGELYLNLNARFAPGQDHQAMIEEIQAHLPESAQTHLADLAPAGLVCHRHPLWADWITGRGLEVTPKQAWTDVAQLTQRGFPAINFGPGDPAQAHQPDEWCEEAQLQNCYEHLSILVQGLAAEH